MIIVAFFEGDSYTKTEYASAVLAALDMGEHITKGGWCCADYKNKTVMVTNLRQLGFE